MKKICLFLSLLLLNLTVCQANIENENEKTNEPKQTYWSELEDNCDHVFGIITKGAFVVAGTSIASLLTYGCIHILMNFVDYFPKPQPNQ